MSTDPTLTRPADVARALGIPASTLRRWSRRFAPFLSAEANGAIRANGTRGHRRYTPHDIAILTQCKELLSAGNNFQQVSQILESSYPAQAVAVEGEIDLDETPIAPSAAPATDLVREEEAANLGQMLAQTLSALSGSQQMLITGQQSERELLGIVLQDNFNLKEENKKLRERMLETERRIFEMKRNIEKDRSDERERMRQMEAYLFQLQRQMDDLIRRAPRAAASSPAPPPAPSEPAPQKRSIWQWLLGK